MFGRGLPPLWRRQVRIAWRRGGCGFTPWQVSVASGASNTSSGGAGETGGTGNARIIDKIAIVVGGGTMIGQSVAETLVGYGADVVIADIEPTTPRPARIGPTAAWRRNASSRPAKTNNFSHQLRLHGVCPGADEKAKLASSFFVHLPNRKLAHPSRSIRALR